MKPTIEVTVTNRIEPDRQWRAVLRLPKAIDWKNAGYSVNGANTTEGPWIDGYGYTPESALATAYQALGRFIIGMTKHEEEIWRSLRTPDAWGMLHPMQAHDYIAVDSRGKRIWGPGTDYATAKSKADSQGGVVKYVFAELPAEAKECGCGAAEAPRLWIIEYDGRRGRNEALIWATTEQAAVGLLRNRVTVDSVVSVRPEDPQGMRRGRNVYAMDCVGVHTHGEECPPDGGTVLRHREETILVGAGESVPVAYEDNPLYPEGKPEHYSIPGQSRVIGRTVSEGPHSQPMRGQDCVALVERQPGCAPTGIRIRTAKDVWDLLHERYSKLGQEVFEVLLINVQGELVGSPVQIASGQRDRVAVEVEQILAAVIPGTAAGAAGFVCVHLHPSSKARPSDADRDLTRRIEKAAAIACPNTAMIDHVIVAPAGPVGGQYYSFDKKQIYVVPVPKGSRRTSMPEAFVVTIRQGRTVASVSNSYAKITDAIDAMQRHGKPGQTATITDNGRVAQYRGGRAVFVFGRTRWSRA